jgi:hypothetical protein
MSRTGTVILPIRYPIDTVGYNVSMPSTENPQRLRLVQDLIRATDNIRGATGRDYRIACHAYEMAKRALEKFDTEESEK